MSRWMSTLASTGRIPRVQKVIQSSPKPAKQVDHLWFISTAIPPTKWPRRFGEGSAFEDENADGAIRRLSGDQAYIFHDDKQTESNLWAFSSRWKSKSRKYHNNADNIEEIVNDVKGGHVEPRIPCVVDLEEVYFICGHGNRDERCGERGRLVLEKLRELNQRAYACSHLGGHAFAGNIVHFPNAAWYSLVHENNVRELISGEFKSVFYRGCSW